MVGERLGVWLVVLLTLVSAGCRREQHHPEPESEHESVGPTVVLSGSSVLVNGAYVARGIDETDGAFPATLPLLSEALGDWIRLWREQRPPWDTLPSVRLRVEGNPPMRRVARVGAVAMQVGFEQASLRIGGRDYPIWLGDGRSLATWKREQDQRSFDVVALPSRRFRLAVLEGCDAEVDTVEPRSVGAGYEDLAAGLEALWKQHGVRRAYDDPERDFATLLYDEAEPFNEVAPLVEALAQVTRKQQLEGYPERVPVFQVHLLTPLPSEAPCAGKQRSGGKTRLSETLGGFSFPPGGRRSGIRSPKIRLGEIDTKAKLPPEVINRIVRQSYSSFHRCYQSGLDRNANLAGRVLVSLTISRQGRVSKPKATQASDLPDAEVVQCLVQTFATMTFPRPERGRLPLTIPLMLSPG